MSKNFNKGFIHERVCQLSSDPDLQELLKKAYTMALIDYVNGKVRVSETMKLRREAFVEALKPYLKTYDKEMLNDFFLYWSEPDMKGLKMRWELEKTWSLEGRLRTWAKNNFNNGKNQKKLPYNPVG